MKQNYSREQKIQLIKNFQEGNLTADELKGDVLIVHDFDSYLDWVGAKRMDQNPIVKVVIGDNPFLNKLAKIQDKRDESKV
ncbi:MAG: hypothetical protein AB7E36_14845 [Salinivirgaceae bacterium]